MYYFCWRILGNMTSKEHIFVRWRLHSVLVSTPSFHSVIDAFQCSRSSILLLMMKKLLQWQVDYNFTVPFITLEWFVQLCNLISKQDKGLEVFVMSVLVTALTVYTSGAMQYFILCICSSVHLGRSCTCVCPRGIATITSDCMTCMWAMYGLSFTRAMSGGVWAGAQDGWRHRMILPVWTVSFL